MGGKGKIGKKIASFLNARIAAGNHTTYWEPFVGSCWVMQHIEAEKRLGSDISEPLISLWAALQNGWIPPEEVDETLYKAAKDGKVYSKMEAFIGYGCSWGGKWFGGYAKVTPGKRYNDDSYAKVAKRSLLKKLPFVEDVEFFIGHYDEGDPPKGSLVYADPPYAGTTGYSYAPNFDHDYFWEVMRKWSAVAEVYISEYSAPADFRCVLEIPTTTDMRTKDAGGKEPRIERLFTWRKP